MNDQPTVLVVQLNEVLDLLNKIERTYALQRTQTISLLQNKIWDTPELQIEELYSLQDFASDLNFYEPIERDRETSLGYYDDNKLLALTSETINTIQTLLGTGND
jgi:hypothetical protein